MKLDVIKLAKEAGYGEVMAALHGPALERFATLVIEKCAVELDGRWDMAAGIIRAMKEPE